MKELLKLLELKSILSLVLILTTCYLALKGKIEIETFTALVMSVVTYYFTRKEN